VCLECKTWIQVSRASFSYEQLGTRTWVVCHGPNSLQELGKKTALCQLRSLNAVFKGPTSKGKEGEGEERRERGGKGKERGGDGKKKGREGRGRTTLHTPCRKFLATPLATCQNS